MEKHNLQQRIAINSEVMMGQAIIKGTRLTVGFILGLLAQGVTIEEILEEYNGLTKEDIMACFLYASKALEQSSVLPLV